MSDEFIDSNVFLYLFDETDTRKRDIAQSLIDTALRTGTACISFQVVQETLNVMTGKLKPPATATEASRFLEAVMAPLLRVMPSTFLYRQALELRDRHNFSFYDSLIVAAAQEAGCKRLLSEDFQHGQRLGLLTIVNPFKD